MSSDIDDTEVDFVTAFYPPADISPAQFEEFVAQLFNSAAQTVDDLDVAVHYSDHGGAPTADRRSCGPVASNDYRVGAGIRSLSLAASSSSSTNVIISTPGAHSITTANRLVLSASRFDAV